MSDPMNKALLRDALGSENLFTSRWAYNANGDVEYIGLAEVGTQNDQPKWLIKKFIYDAQQRPESVLFSGGRAAFDSVWNDRSSCVYS